MTYETKLCKSCGKYKPLLLETFNGTRRICEDCTFKRQQKTLNRLNKMLPKEKASPDWIEKHKQSMESILSKTSKTGVYGG